MKILPKIAIVVVLGLIPGLLPFSCQAEDLGGEISVSEVQKLITDWKASERGPFSRILWFCPDGSTRLPRQGACRGRGGDGIQHGELNKDAERLRRSGIPIVHVLAGLSDAEISELVKSPDSLTPILIERVLVTLDEGWIFRKAQFYRGAFQIEDEARVADGLLNRFLGSEPWLNRFLLLREAWRLLPHSNNSPVLAEARALATTIARRESRFVPIRNKLHSYPDSRDITLVRNFLSSVKSGKSRAPVMKLIQTLEAFYDIDSRYRTLFQTLNRGNFASNGELGRSITEDIGKLYNASDTRSRLDALGGLLRDLREILPMVSSYSRSAVLEASVLSEELFYAEFSRVFERTDGAAREDILLSVSSTIDALYGTGLLEKREYRAAQFTVARILENSLTLLEYNDELEHFRRVPGWALKRLEREYGDTLPLFIRFEPLATQVLDDRLRASPLLFFSRQLEQLSYDSQRALGVMHRFFGRQVSGGLRRLNPGMARGVLKSRVRPGESEAIVLAPETATDLPAVSGILTEREGNLLSHIQILARNLGVPNVVVGGEHLGTLKRRLGYPIVVATSPRGVVHIDDDSRAWDQHFPRERPEDDLLIVPNLEKIELSERELKPLRELRSVDSGRIVGPKAAQLGELGSRFPKSVTSGVVVPFGVFRDFLRLPVDETGQSLFDWMKGQYRLIAAEKQMSGKISPRVRFVLGTIRDKILRYRFPDKFVQTLLHSLRKEIGDVARSGVFVRSDTNVEDLPGFTGAGLNKTVPNVMDQEGLLGAIREVWASPFTERAYSWRQAHMEEPEHLYVSVLIMRSVPVEKSGVLVTADITNGDTGWMTVAANEGVGGVVDDALAETLLIRKSTGTVRLLSSAMNEEKRVLSPRGGIEMAPIVPKRVLAEGELVQLVDLAREVSKGYPGLEGENGRVLPADIEYGFLRGRLVLFQIRPFLESKKARKTQYLRELDAKLLVKGREKVRLVEPLLEESRQIGVWQASGQ